GTEYYDSVVRGQFQERVLVSWPGPSGLLELWHSGELGEGKKLSILLGGAAFHDTQLLPLYREALLSRGPRLRQAAAYGYRDLIGDDVPNVRGGVSPKIARDLVGELDAVARTVQRRTLVEMWLASALAGEGRRPRDWHGITLKRSSAMCLRAVERLAGIEDLEAVVGAYELSGDRANQVFLMRLIEGLSMGRLVVKPKGQGKGWGSTVYDEAFERLDLWLSVQCDLNVAAVLEKGVSDLGVRGVDPMSPAACDAWLQILSKGPPPFWAVAADRLYHCGGPAIRLSLIRPDTEINRNRRKRLRAWYGD
ncbi:MAG: hypothetical protein ABFS37_16005, partial [Acidobacteriota bacterium]